MAEAPKIVFSAFAAPAAGLLVVFMNGELRVGTTTGKLLGRNHEVIARAARAEKFSGKLGAALDFLGLPGVDAGRLLVIGSGTEPPDFAKLGGMVMSKIPASATEITVLLELPSGPMKPQEAAEFALGLSLRAYAFERYKTKRKEGEEKRGKQRVSLGVADAAASRKAWARREAIYGGIVLARDLVNEPPNVLYPQ